MSRTRALAVAAAATALLAVPGATAAQAAPEAPMDGTVTWSVVPADAGGQDGRRVIDVALEPGGAATEHIAVANHSDEAVSFVLAANDGYLTERGSFDMLPSGTPPTGGGAWLFVPSEVRVGAGETVVVPVGIAVPADAVPGDHPAGVTASLRAGREVEVEYRVGVRVNLRVSGEVVTSLAAEVVSAAYEQSWNPFAPGEVVMVVEVVNDGTIGVGVAAAAEAVTSIGGSTSGGSAVVVPEIFPGGRTEISTRVPGMWPLGPMRVAAEIDTVIPDDLAGVTSPTHVTVSTRLWTFPLAQSALLLALVLAVLTLRKASRLRRARLQRLLDQARAEGAARALANR